VKRLTSVRRPAWALMAGIAIVLCVLLYTPAVAQQNVRYFEETGHNVSGEFLEFFDRHGGLAIFGYPLTREFEENGRVVQYFQRARMEKHPENPDPYKVQLGLLGEELKGRDPPIPESEIPQPYHPDKQYFSETGHTVTFSFLSFYRENGGLDVFGYPITEWCIEDTGRIVQYFQRTKMEWYPENPPGQRVQLALLGSAYVERYVDPEFTRRELAMSYGEPITRTRVEQPASRRGVTEIEVNASLKHAIIGSHETQTVYVYVVDQHRRGVPRATIELQVQYDDGTSELRYEQTDLNGSCQIEFDVKDSGPGTIVVVNVAASYQDAWAETAVAFLPWW